MDTPQTDDVRTRSQCLSDAADAVVLAARRLSHGRRRDGAPRVTIAQLERALDEAVDGYEVVR